MLGWCYVGVLVSQDSLCRWQVLVSVYCAWWIPAHLRCIIMLHLMDIYFLTCIYLQQILQIQTLIVCCCQTWISLDITNFCEQHRQPSSGCAWPACPKKTVNLAPIGVVGFDTICTIVYDRSDSSTACRLCCLEPVFFCCIIEPSITTQATPVTVTAWCTTPYTSAIVFTIICIILLPVPQLYNHDHIFLSISV